MDQPTQTIMGINIGYNGIVKGGSYFDIHKKKLTLPRAPSYTFMAYLLYVVLLCIKSEYCPTGYFCCSRCQGKIIYFFPNQTFNFIPRNIRFKFALWAEKKAFTSSSNVYWLKRLPLGFYIISVLYRGWQYMDVSYTLYLRFCVIFMGTLNSVCFSGWKEKYILYLWSFQIKR